MIPFASTTVSALRASAQEDGFPDTEPTWAAFATGVRGHFSVLRGEGSEAGQANNRSEVISLLSCDVIPGLTHKDRIVDDNTGDMFDVQAVLHRYMLVLDHMLVRCVRHSYELGAETAVS